MNAPQRVPASQFNELVTDWLNFNTFKTFLDFKGEPKFACKKCGSDILWRRAFLSVHDVGWSVCCGNGEVLNPTIPYCPKCEPNVNVFGCLHNDAPAAPPQKTGWDIDPQALLIVGVILFCLVFVFLDWNSVREVLK